MILKRKVLWSHQGAARDLFSLFLLLLIFWGGGREGVSLAQTRGIPVRPSVNLYGASFLTRDEGWAIGQLGKIFHTTNGGQSWEEQQSGTNLLLAAVEFIDHTHGWVVGERGIILHTRDGGLTWTQQLSGVPYLLFDVEFLDQDKGWVVGHWGTILYTEDGGKHWTEKSLSLPLEEKGLIEPAVLQGVTDPQTGEVIVKAGQLLTQELIGEIYQRGIEGVRIREDVVLNAVFFLDQEHGWIAGERGLVLCTGDGGRTWERTELPHPSIQGGEEVMKEGLGGEFSEEELAAYGVEIPLPSIYGIFFVSPLHGWAVGQEGTIAWTQDGGRQWAFQPSGTQEALYDIGIIGNMGWIVGDKGTLLVSIDGGRQWKRRELGLEYRLSWLRRLAVVSGDHAFMVGANGLVLVSGTSAEQGLWVQQPGAK